MPIEGRFASTVRTYREVGIGAPSSARSSGVATVVYANSKPTIRINILTARFMVFLLGAGPLGAETLTLCRALYKFVSSGLG
jgi:hypothetical protein